MAQLGSALVWGTRGRWFESSHPDQSLEIEKERVSMKDSKLSFVIFQQKFGKSYSFSISYFALSLMAMSVVLSIIAVGVGVYFSFSANYMKSAYVTLQKESGQQENYIKRLDEQFVGVQDQLISLIETEERLEALLGKAHVKKKSNFTQN